MALSGRDIVCIGFADWQAEQWTNQQHLMSRLARANRVLFVESLGLRRPSVDSRDLARMGRRVRRGLMPPRPMDGLHVLSPLVVPLHGQRVVRELNARLLPALVGRASRRLGLRRPILWGYVPQAEALVDVLNPSLVVYHCVDDIAAQKGIDSASFQAAEARFTARADLVLASAPSLARRLRQINSNVLDAPNVASTDLFARALDPGPIDPALALLPEPRIVFVGAIVATKLDVDLIVSLARLRPDWSFALIGAVGLGDPRGDISALDRESNVHLLGVRRYEQLPAVLRGAAAGLIPYELNELTASVFPMKVYEYLAAGLPVIATPLPSLEGVDAVAFAPDAPTTSVALERLIADDDRERRLERSQRARGHSWNARLEEIGDAISRTERRVRLRS